MKKPTLPIDKAKFRPWLEAQLSKPLHQTKRPKAVKK